VRVVDHHALYHAPHVAQRVAEKHLSVESLEPGGDLEEQQARVGQNLSVSPEYFRYLRQRIATLPIRQVASLCRTAGPPAAWMMLTVPSIFKQPARASGADDDNAHLRVLDPVLNADHSKQPLLGNF
jgi:hypothetical protein